jgi:hypothetical protein
MRPRERRDSGERDLYRARLDQIIDLNHELAKLARAIDWRFLEEKFGAVYTRVSERMCKQVSVSLPYRGDSHDDQYDDYTGVAGSTAC